MNKGCRDWIANRYEKNISSLKIIYEKQNAEFSVVKYSTLRCLQCFDTVG